MWIDKWIYWAWKGGPEGFCDPPSEKHIILVQNEYGVNEARIVIELHDA